MNRVCPQCKALIADAYWEEHHLERHAPKALRRGPRKEVRPRSGVRGYARVRDPASRPEKQREAQESVRHPYQGGRWSAR